MKVLIVSHLWPRQGYPYLGPFVAEQAEALRKWCDVSVCTPVNLTPRAEELTLSQIFSGCPKYRSRTRPKLAYLGETPPTVVPYRSPLYRQFFANTSAQHLAASLAMQNLPEVDLVHAHTLFPDGLACAYWLEDKSIPLVVTIHGSDLYAVSGSTLKALPRLYQRANLLIPVSQALGKQLALAGAPEKKITMLQNGFTSSLFENVQFNLDRPKKIVFLGRLDKIKRVDLLIRALQDCPAEVTLEIAGEGSEAGSLNDLTQKLNLSNRVRFLGTLTREQIPGFLSQAALLCLVSTREGWPTVVFESFICGTPILCTAVGGLPEAISSPDLGTLVPKDISPQQLAEAIMADLDKKWDHRLIHEHALGFTWEKIALKLKQLYDQTLDGTRASLIERP